MLTKTLNEEEIDTKSLLAQYSKSKDPKIKNEIVKKNILTVKRIAINFSKNTGESVDDLIQVGCIGLVSAVERFDPSQNASFKTYSSHLIAGEIKHYLRDYSNIIKLPRELQELQPKVNRAKQSLSNIESKEVSSKDIAKFLNIDEDKVQQVFEMEKSINAISLDQQIQSDDSNSRTIGEQIEDKKYLSFQLAQEDKIIIQEAINEIKDQSRQVIEYAFYQDLSQTEIAQKMGISQMQVSRKIKGAIKELWDILNSRVTPW
ncbi:MAG: sigma-70 family RNA polymerase sigma factor [Candidatus Sericytochromatia bacterium]